jgi:hypothetical protein
MKDPRVKLYRITWVYRDGAPDLVSSRPYTWAEVEHEQSFDDGEVTTTYEDWK